MLQTLFAVKEEPKSGYHTSILVSSLLISLKVYLRSRLIIRQCIKSFSYGGSRITKNRYLALIQKNMRNETKSFSFPERCLTFLCFLRTLSTGFFAWVKNICSVAVGSCAITTVIRNGPSVLILSPNLFRSNLEMRCLNGSLGSRGTTLTLSVSRK